MKSMDINRCSVRYANYYIEFKNGKTKQAYVKWDEASGQFFPFEKDMFYADVKDIEREYIRAGISEHYDVFRNESGYPYTKIHTDLYYDE